MALKTIGEQMAALNTSGVDTSFATDHSNSLLNATCPARIQNNTSLSNASFTADTTTSSGVGKWKTLRPKREALKITPLAQIDEVPLPAKKYGYVSTSSSSSSSRDKRSDYKTRLCEAFRRNGWCSYNNNCTYAHGESELQMPKRRSPSDAYRGDSRDHHHHHSHHQRDLHRRPSRDRHHLNRSGSRRHNDGGGDDRSTHQLETSFGRWGASSSSSRHRDDNHSRPPSHHHQSSSSATDGPRPICHAFQRGNCRYGPRCRYLHQEQLPHFNANATMFAAPPPDSISYYHHQNTTQTYMMPYFIPIPQQHQQPQLQQPQFVDMNQSMPMYLAPPPSMGSYYCPPQTPVMDQSGGLLMAAPPSQFEPVYNMPPPAIMPPLLG